MVRRLCLGGGSPQRLWPPSCAADPLTNATQLTTQAHGSCNTVDGRANPLLSTTTATTLLRLGSVSKLVTATAPLPAS